MVYIHEIQIHFLENLEPMAAMVEKVLGAAISLAKQCTASLPDLH